MHKILEIVLVKKYPKIFKDYGGDMRKTCMAWGLACGRGWFLLLDELCSKLKGHDVTARQVKEKFGGLRFYLSGDDKAHDIVSEYESKSTETCENCGEPAKVESDHGWLKTICSSCKEKGKLAAKIREGQYAYCFDEPGHIVIYDPIDDPEGNVFSGTFSEFMELMSPYLSLLEDPMSIQAMPLWEQIDE